MSEIPGQVPAAPNETGTSEALPARHVNWERLDALLESLPPGIPLLPPEDARNFSKYTHNPPHDYVPGDGWKHCARAVEKYDAELCKGYREEIDTLLVFAGLFSAVVTAFTIESYRWLQSDPNDAMIVLLSHIAQSVSPNNTAVPLPAASTGLPGPVSIRINIYWFLALALSLSAALVSILCKQWVREFERNVGLTPKQFLGVHQTKLEGLENWRLGEIISILPLMLQLALALFGLGALELLWQLDSTVAALVCVPAIAALLFYLGTTILPVLQYRALLQSHHGVSFWNTLSQCPYKSPQAVLALRALDLCLWIRRAILCAILHIVHSISVARYCLMKTLRSSEPSPFPPFTGDPMRWRVYFVSWDAFDINCLLDDALYNMTGSLQPASLYRSLSWLRTNLDDGDLDEWIWRCIWEVADGGGDFGRGKDSETRGVYYVRSGSTDTPRVGAHAIALGYLLRAPVPDMFAVEACIQNLMSMDPGSAEYLIGDMFLGCSRLDPRATVATLRAFNAYVRLHLQRESIGSLIANVAVLLMDFPDRKLRKVLSACTLPLYLNWLRMQPVPYLPATVEATGAMIFVHYVGLLDDRTDYTAHPEQLRRRFDVQELAELTQIFALSHEESAVSLETRIIQGLEEKLRPIVNQLLDIARHGGGPEADDAAATSAAEPVTRVSRAPGSLYEVRDCEEPLERSAPNEDSPAGAYHDRTRYAEPDASLSARTTEQDGGSRSSTPAESPTLHAVIIHERPSDVAALEPDGHRGAAARVRSTDGNAAGDDGRAPGRQSEA